VSKRIRYQGAILRDDHLLLIKHRDHVDGREYWIIPGGGRENGETEEECVVREMCEDLHVYWSHRYKTRSSIPLYRELFPGNSGICLFIALPQFVPDWYSN